MKRKTLFGSLLAASLLIPITGLWAQEPAPQIHIITSFDYPGTNNLTIPEGINNRGDICGFYTDNAGVNRGFIRFANGVFSDPLVEPNDTGNLTEARGINYSRTLAGFYVDGSTGFNHGFTWSHGVFTEYQNFGSNNTLVEGINDVGDICGASDTNFTGLQAFVNIGGTVTFVSISGSSSSYAFGINRAGTFTGQYTDNSGVTHGYYQTADGTFTSFDPEGSTTTLPFGINNRGLIVGRVINVDGLNRAFLYKPTTGASIVFDYPNSVFTSFNGINKDGLICGRYDDGTGILHGILARAVTQ